MGLKISTRHMQRETPVLCTGCDESFSGKTRSRLIQLRVFFGKK
jgi:hypothetical protein